MPHLGPNDWYVISTISGVGSTVLGAAWRVIKDARAILTEIRMLRLDMNAVFTHLGIPQPSALIEAAKRKAQ